MSGSDAVISGYNGSSLINPILTIPSSITTQSGTTLKVVGLRYDTTAYSPYAFKNVGNMQSVAIPSTVRSIDESTFANCASLLAVQIPSSVKTIGNSAFAHCTKLWKVVLDSDVTTIGNSVFYDTGLTTITVPESVTRIGARNFCGSKTVTVQYAGSPSSWAKISIGTENTNYTVEYAKSDPAPAAPTVTSFSASGTAYSTNAYLHATATASGEGSWTMGGMYVWQNGSVVREASRAYSNTVGTSLTIAYDLTQDLGVTLSPSTTYNYQFWADFNGARCWSTYGTFTTQARPSVSWTNSISNLTETGVTISARATANGNGRITQYGWEMRNMDTNEVYKQGSNSCNATRTTPINWTLQYLTPYHNYSYQFYIVYEGGAYYSDWYSFRTPDYTAPTISYIILIHMPARRPAQIGMKTSATGFPVFAYTVHERDTLQSTMERVARNSTVAKAVY